MSDSKKWTAMMSRKPELDLGGQARKIENQRLQIKRLTEKNLGLRSALDDSKTRIAELEAEVARLRAAHVGLCQKLMSDDRARFGDRTIYPYICSVLKARAALNPGKDTP
jgi:predicted RNase H-like nuclease (RuvC/YqgF family)